MKWVMNRIVKCRIFVKLGIVLDNVNYWKDKCLTENWNVRNNWWNLNNWCNNCECDGCQYKAKCEMYYSTKVEVW